MSISKQIYPRYQEKQAMQSRLHSGGARTDNLAIN